MAAAPPRFRRPDERVARIAALAALAAATVLLLVVVAVTLIGRPPEAGAADQPARGGRAAARPITIAWAGDTTLGSVHGLPPDRGRPLLAPVRDVLRAADLTVLNYEGTLASSGASKCGADPSDACFAFRAPPENAATLRHAGVDLVNLANNHANDYGPVALEETAAALAAAGVGATGRVARSTSPASAGCASRRSASPPIRGRTR